MPIETFTTPNKRLIAGIFPSDHLYGLVGTNSSGGAYNVTELLNRFNSEWTSLQTGGSWSALQDASSSLNGYYIRQSTSGVFSRYITGSNNWPRNLDVSGFLKLVDGSRYINLFCCVQDVNNYYRIVIDRGLTTTTSGSQTVTLYKRVGGAETLVGSRSYSFYWTSDGWVYFRLRVDYNNISLYLGAGDDVIGYQRLSINDNSLTHGGFGIGSTDAEIGFKNITVRSLTVNDYRKLKLSYPLYIQGQVNVITNIYNPNYFDSIAVYNQDFKYPLELKKLPSDLSANNNTFQWTKAHSGHLYSLSPIATNLNTGILLFKNPIVEDGSVFVRYLQNDQSIGYVFDYVDQNNFKVILHTTSNTYIDQFVNGVQSNLVNILGYGNYLNEITDWYYYITTDKVVIRRADVEVYNAKPSVSWRDTANQGQVGFYSSGGMNCLFDLEVYHTRRDYPDEGNVTSDIAEMFKFGGSVAKQSFSTLGMKAYLDNRRNSTINLTGRILKTWITKTPSFLDPLETGPFDLLTGASIKRTMTSTLQMKALIRNIYISPNLLITAALRKTRFSELTMKGRLLGFFNDFILNDTVDNGEWTNQAVQTFYVTSQLLNDPVVDYFRYSFSTNPSDTPTTVWNGQALAMPAMTVQDRYYFRAEAYSAEDELLGTDVYIVGFDNINPIVNGPYVENLPISEDGDMVVKVQDIQWDTEPQKVEIKVYRNAVLYKTEIFENPDHLLRTFNITNNEFDINDQIDIQVTAFDRAGNTATDYAGYNYSGDDLGRLPTDYIVIQRYGYRVAIWEGGLTADQLNSHYCPNLATDLIRKWDCPISEANILFMPETHKVCPYCQFPLVPGSFDLTKKVFQTNFRPRVPFGKINEEDDLSILKLAMDYAYLYQAKSWFYRLEERETPYGQDIIELGAFNDVVILGNEKYRLHFEVQFSETTNFNDEIILTSDTFSSPYDFEIYSGTDDTWRAILSGGLYLSSGTVRYRMPRSLEVGKLIFFRWRVIRELNSAREYNNWSAITSHTIQKFTNPTEVWDGSYREHLLDSNFGFEGFVTVDHLEESTSVDYGEATKDPQASVVKFTPNEVDNVVLNFDLDEITNSNEGNRVIVKVKFRSNSLVQVSPTVRNIGLTQTNLTDLQQDYDDDLWHILIFDLTQSALFDSEQKDQMGVSFHFPLPDPLSYVEVDYVAFLYKNPTYRKRYFYPHVLSNTMRCIFEQKGDDPNVFKADGRCTKLHTPGAAWKGEWQPNIQYTENDGVVINNGTEYIHYIAITTPAIGISPTSLIDWDVMGSTPLGEPLPEGDGLYQGGSTYQNPNTTGFCKNVSCPDYNALPTINESTEMIFDLDSTTISEDILEYQAEATSGFLGCPNNGINEDGSPQCHNNKYKIGIPPARKICSRNEGFKNPENFGNFDYRCTKFCMPTESEGSPYGVVGRYDTAGVPYNDPDHPQYPGVTFIPAELTEETFYITDPINGDRIHFVYSYPAIHPNKYYWDYDDPQTTCDGLLRDTGEVCGNLLVGYSVSQRCPECDTPLVPLGTITTAVVANRCSNYNKNYQVVPRCTLAQNEVPQPETRIYCTESGDTLVPFNRPAILSLTTPIRQFTLTQSQVKRIADGLPKTYAYRGWDFLLNVPYTGYIGGSGGVFVEGDVWTGVTTFRKRYATAEEVNNWDNLKQIANNLVNRTTNELLTFETKMETFYLEQYKKNVRYGDIESAIIKPGSYSNGYTIPLNDLELYAEQAEFANNRLGLQVNNYIYSGIKEAFVRSRNLFEPAPTTTPWEIKFKLSVTSNSLSAMNQTSANTDSVLGQFGLGLKWGKIGGWNEVDYNYQESLDTILSFQILGWNPDGTRRGKIQFLASTTNPPFPSDLITNLTTNNWTWTTSFNIVLDCTLRIEGSQIVVSVSYNDPILGAKTNTAIISRDYYLPAPMAFAGFAYTAGIKFDLYDVAVNPIVGNQEFIDRNLINTDIGTVFNDESDLFRLISRIDGDPFKIYAEWSETYYLLELDPKPNFDSRRGLPMRRILGKGWMCLHKARGEVKGVRIPSGFLNQSSCKMYKHVFSEQEAFDLHYKCPSCGYKLFVHRFDANLLSLIGTDKEIGKTNIMPKLVYQMNQEELPGLNNSDYLMLDLDQDGDQDYTNRTTILGTEFFENTTENQYHAYDLGTGWTERRMAKLDNEVGWVETYAFDVQHWYNKINNNSLFVPLDETPKQGKILTQTIQTNINPSWEFSYQTGIFRIAAAKEIVVSGMTDLVKQQNFSDIRWSVFLPTAGHFWSASESYVDTNFTDKRSLVEVELLDTSNNVLGTFRYILSSTKLDYYDYIEKPYSTVDTISDIYLRTPHRNDLDKWIYFKQNVYQDASNYLQDNSVNLPWSSVDKIRFNLVTEIIRQQTDLDLVRGQQSVYFDISLRSNYCVTVWGEFHQGWTALLDPADTSKLAISPKAWNGIYYCRAIPYAIKLNPQYYEWWRKIAIGFGIATDELDWPTAEMVRKYGMPPTKWMIRYGQPTASTDFYYGYDWNTVYNSEDKVVLPEGL